MSTQKQKRLLRRKPAVVVGTPGRIFALLGMGEEDDKMILMKKQIGEDKDGLKPNGKNGARTSSANGMMSPDLPWDELQVEEISVLPDEVLGWLLLRRANLSASSRLSVQASVNNSLKFSDIELALRDQEEELLQADLQRGHPHGRRRTYWVEEDGQWGLLASPVEDGYEDTNEIHWVGAKLPPDVYDPGPSPSSGGDSLHDDDEVYWSWESDGWHGYVWDQGLWMETDGFGTYWASEDNWSDLNPEEYKELEEAFLNYESKARTFQQSRQFQRAKGASRGFYPLNMMKGKKGKGKGKSKKGKSISSSLTSSSSTSTRPLFVAKGTASSSTTTGTGCFICGDHGHGFRNCPQRGKSNGKGKGGHKGTFWLESMTPSSLDFIGMTADATDSSLVTDTTGYGVLDLGATETVGSLEALEGLMRKREHLLGDQWVDVYHDAAYQRPFRFGNGGVQFSLIPQRLGDQTVSLGLFTIDAERVPILVGMKTLTKLGAIIDVAGQWMVLANVAPNQKVPLQRSRAGHLLIDLTKDWLDVSEALALPSHQSERANMVRAVVVDLRDHVRDL
eukprot:g725.t1